MEFGKFKVSAPNVGIRGPFGQSAAMPLSLGMIEMVFVSHRRLPTLASGSLWAVGNAGL